MRTCKLRSLMNAALASGTLFGCASDFESQMTLSGYRVVGIEASAPEVAADGQLDLTVYEYYDGQEALGYNWSLCLQSWGAPEAYACLVPELELGSQSVIAVDLGPNGLNLPQRLAELPDIADEDGSSARWMQDSTFGSS